MDKQHEPISPYPPGTFGDLSYRSRLANAVFEHAVADTGLGRFFFRVLDWLNRKAS